jgi:hypothetical protein
VDNDVIIISDNTDSEPELKMAVRTNLLISVWKLVTQKQTRSSLKA